MNKSKYLNYLKEINNYNFNIYLLHEPIIFIVLSYLLPLNINSTVVVCLCLALSITISILISKFYYYAAASQAPDAPPNRDGTDRPYPYRPRA